MPIKRQGAILAAWGAILSLFIFVLAVNILIYRGVGGTTLVRTLSADAEWAIVAVGIYAVIVELGKPPEEKGKPRRWRDN